MIPDSFRMSLSVSMITKSLSVCSVPKSLQANVSDAKELPIKYLFNLFCCKLFIALFAPIAYKNYCKTYQDQYHTNNVTESEAVTDLTSCASEYRM
jgi:hypothetical protein